MTKAEFLEQVAGDERIGSKKAAADAVDSVLDAITATLTSGGEVNFTGFGKFHVAERSARQGVNPRTGERITIAGGKVPRFSAGSALEKSVKGWASSSIGLRRSSKSAAARSALDLTPTRRTCRGRERISIRAIRVCQPPNAPQTQSPHTASN
mgnify:CR=1 FL=1